MNKQCFKCLKSKPLNDFYKHGGMADGHLNKCKECTSMEARKNREANLEYYLAYDRTRGAQEDRIRSRKQYAQTESGKAAILRGKEAWVSRNMHKVAASRAVNNAKRDGRIISEPCQVCGNPNSQGHHEDYSKPLEVIWLCPKHHAELHKQKRIAA